MLEIASLLTVPEHVDRLSHAAPDSGEVDSAQPSSHLLPDDDAGYEQVTDGPLEELLVRESGDSEHSILVLELVDIEEVGKRLILVVAADGAEC